MHKELAKSIGKVARSARLAQKLTQEDAAERIKVSTEFYARIERGTSLPSIQTFIRLVHGLGVSADALLGRGLLVANLELSPAWAPTPETEPPEIRRLLRQLRRAQPSALRLVNLLLKELQDRPPANEQHLDTALAPEPDDD